MRTILLRMFALAPTIIAIALPALADQLSEPLAPAAKGQLQCYTPDTSRKSCMSLAGYKSGADGKILNTAIVLISANPPITMQIVSIVEIRDGKVCGKVLQKDIDAAKFTASGQALDAGQARSLREQVAVAYKPALGHEICTAYVPDGDALIAKASLDGAPMVGADQRVIWVSVKDSYKVGP